MKRPSKIRELKTFEERELERERLEEQNRKREERKAWLAEHHVMEVRSRIQPMYKCTCGNLVWDPELHAKRCSG